ncbi:cell wall hydrolase [Novosphingobium aquae]|jgi:N-acetylmuramoyl-L-alanine amidase|uniref:Cell wall hydrolase n=1 Tax=Novosphingobium aquae TaxID=3133435 RepID=A0ABU8S9S5_9SPHN
MSRKTNFAGTVALASMFAFTLFSSEPTGAAALAQDSSNQNDLPALNAPYAANERPDIQVQPIPDSEIPEAPEADADDASPDTAPVSAASLQQLVVKQASSAPLSRELNCLAGAIYFESKSEPLVGQLAVGRVIVARSRSGRFPNSYCGVVYQPSQFSFVRGGTMPAIPKGSQDWKEAVAVAQIAHEGSWKSPVEGAMFFHAARVSPGWRLARVGKLGNHVFYR